MCALMITRHGDKSADRTSWLLAIYFYYHLLAPLTLLRPTSTLLYCLGNNTADVLTSTDISEEGTRAYSKVLEKFNNFSI